MMTFKCGFDEFDIIAIIAWKCLYYLSTMQDPLYGLLGSYLKLKEGAGSGKQVYINTSMLSGDIFCG